MVCYSLKTLNKLKEAEEKERQMETKHATTKAAAMLSNILALSLTKVNPFVSVEIPLLLPEV
jgi:hypothetical protein